ncbi:MAG: sulfotransferase domain-containing protein [Planctomycetes bacterium]|nr:sulfotransferase domain-containing protein [Planctomycetota bacterium]
MRTLVWLASFPKSGNTWTRAFIAAYLSGGETFDLKQISRYSRSESLLALFADRAGKPAAELTDEDIDANRQAAQERLAQNIGRCVVKTHNARLNRDHRRLIFSRYTRSAIYLIRNPLDVVDSLADHTNKSFDETIELMNQPRHRLGATAKHAAQYVGTWSHHVETWINNNDEFPVLVLRYEDLKANPYDTFGELVRFLNWEFDDARLRRAIDLTSFERVRRAEDEYGFAEASDVARSGRFFRHGEVDRWRKVLSSSQAAAVIEHHGAAMRVAGYDLPDLAATTNTVRDPHAGEERSTT